MVTRRSTAALIASVALVGVAACGDDDDAPAASVVGSAPVAAATTDEPTGTISDELRAFCAPMQELADFNADAEPFDPEQEWSEFRAEVAQRSEGALALYDDAIAAAPGDVAADLVVLRDFTVSFVEVISESESADDLQQSGAFEPSEAVIAATEDVDGFIRQNCGFGLSEG